MASLEKKPEVFVAASAIGIYGDKEVMKILMKIVLMVRTAYRYSNNMGIICGCVERQVEPSIFELEMFS